MQRPRRRAQPDEDLPGEAIVAGLSQTLVRITTRFSGSEIFIYGAVRRESPIPEGAPLDVLVQVIGPVEPVVIRKKERRFGIWINDSGVTVDAAPRFYAVATTRSFEDTISFTEDLRYRVGLDHAVRLIGTPQDLVYPEPYRRAAIRLRQTQGVYSEQPGGVTIKEGTLFSTSIALPSQIVEGDYRARIMLLRAGQVLDIAEDTITVSKVGLERWIYTTASEQPALYGALSLAIALAAGWAASALFRVFLP
jgi:uncharacterized protein (TIGR02186 family)